jgi:RimJ/RimL family protein N-acetyltransferase
LVLAIEHDPEVAPWITQWPRERHSEAIHAADEAHLMVIEDGSPVGFVLLAGLTRSDRVVELGRIALSRRGGGIGRQALAQALDLAFDVYGAERVWLDVVPGNARAKHLYLTSGLNFERTIPDDHPSSPAGAVLEVMSTRREDRPATS